MPRMYDAVGRTDDLTAAMIAIISRDGVRALSLRGACRESGTATASALHHYGGWARLQRLGARLTWDWRQRSILLRLHIEGAAAFFPTDDDDLAEARAWLGWQEIGRTDQAIGELVAGVRDDELATVARLTEAELDRTALLVLHAAVEGLVAARCARIDPMSAAEATQLLERLVATLSPGAGTPATAPTTPR